MSRIGKLPIAIPAGVEIKIDGTSVNVKGPKGTMVKEFHPDMIITIEDNQVLVARPSDEPLHRSLHGLTRTLLANMVHGVTQG
ncbi:MAG TPA: 50S ribosomal protein L6, partial [Verrucomicrobiae bacterium]|nr:50S ribosomal protein L6 [Verrucomicrobiae bacterium]